MNEVTMPFGKYKGVPVNRIPKNYLDWLTDNVDMYPWLKVAVESALSGETGKKKSEDNEETRIHRIIKFWSPSDGETVVI